MTLEQRAGSSVTQGNALTLRWMSCSDQMLPSSTCPPCLWVLLNSRCIHCATNLRWRNFFFFYSGDSLLNPLPCFPSRAGCCPVGWMTAKSRTTTRSAWRRFSTVSIRTALARCVGRNSLNSAGPCSWTMPRRLCSKRCCTTRTATRRPG